MKGPGTNRAVLIGALCVGLALIMGLGLGLLFSRGLKAPCQSDRALASLGADSQQAYIVLVAAAYSLDHDLERTQARLARLEASDINQRVADLIDRYIAEGRDEADIRALAGLGQALGVESPQSLAYLATPTLPPTGTPLPKPSSTPPDTPAPAVVLSATLEPPTREPTAVPPTPTKLPDTPTLSPTPTNVPSATPVPPTSTAVPSDTPQPQPTNTAAPKPTATAQPSATAAIKWTYTAQLDGPGREGHTCDFKGQKLIRVTVLDAAGIQIPGVWLYDRYQDLYQVSGHKGDDPFWGPGEVEFSGMEGSQLCIASGEGGVCESDLTRDLPTHDPPPLEDLWAAGYCACCEPDITRERCQELRDQGECVATDWYNWHVEFKRSW